MIIEKIKSDGLSHLSYLLGDGGEAAVIDPRRDCEIYVEKARKNGLKITHIFETHRNEDLISGAPILAAMTGATVHHGPDPAKPIRYADTVRDGDRFTFGDLILSVLETPGHTDDHLAYAVYDNGFNNQAVAVFTGDALFVGDVGRTDFYPDRSKEVAGLLFDSLHKILKLGDQAVIYPAHGAGSVCGSGMASREFSTIGHERLNNPRLQIESRDDFIAAKVNETHYIPPYFRTMERLNVEGADPVARVAIPRPLSLSDLVNMNGIDQIVDVRSVTGFAGAHWPGSLCMPVQMLSAYAGWFLPEECRIALVADDDSQAREAAILLARIGYDNLVGMFSDFVPAIAAGKPFATLDFVAVEEVQRRLKANLDDWALLDVRGLDEVEEVRIDGTQHIYLGHLCDQLDELDHNRKYTTMCASGARATVAAAWLKANDFDNVDVFLGSIGAWYAHEAAH